MARMYPEIFPVEGDQNNPESKVFQILRELPDQFSVIYSKKFKGGKSSKEEAEIDFLIFDGKRNLICLEVKGGEIAYSGPERAWYQNGSRMEKAPATLAQIESISGDVVTAIEQIFRRATKGGAS